MAETSGYTAQPGALTAVAATGLASGLVMGYRVIKAATQTVAIGRTEVGVEEASPGAYVASFIAPAEPDLYLVIFDWNGGVLEELTSVTYDFIVQGMAMVEDTGFGRIADYARLSLGGETWKGLHDDPNYGPETILLAVEAVKARTMSSPPATANETDLLKPVLSYLGKLVALELLPAARVWWGNQLTSQVTGDDPREIVTWANRDRMLDALQDMLLRQIRAEAPLALELLPGPVLRSVDDGPQIDEDDQSHYVTEDPREFPSIAEFPVHAHPIPNRARYNRAYR